MGRIQTRGWKRTAFRGFASVGFGLLAFQWPTVTLAAVAALFGAYALVDGAIAIARGTNREAREHSWLFALEGLVGVTAGFVAFAWTGMTSMALTTVVAAWAILTGAVEIAAAVRLHREVPGEMLLGETGLGSVLLGVAMLVSPPASAVLMLTLMGTYAVMFGAATIVLSLRLRRLDALARGAHQA